MRALTLSSVLLMALACRDSIDEDDKIADTVPVTDTDDDVLGPPDADGDGWTAEDDCDDGDAAVFPGAEEVCNGIDDDCDAEIDNDATDAFTVFADADGDARGDDLTARQTCRPDAGEVLQGGDCDDADATVFPSADKLCNDRDDDCDTEIDEDPVDALTWYADSDGDGFGDLDAPLAACTAPADHTADATDCDDADADVRPSADERCNGIDDDCDAIVDEPDAIDVVAWYADVDGDGFGDALSAQLACAAPANHVADATDCDDAQDDAFPGADERCNGVDDDCDTLVDEEAVDASSFYTDLDGDGFGDATALVLACDAPADAVSDATDCDDTIASIFPGAPELCDGLDNDCTGVADDDAGLDGAWYADVDGDGFGDDAVTQVTCAQPAGFVAASGDCDDTSALTFPGADEDCDPADRDCDGDPTDDAVDAVTYWLDVDGDGYGGSLASIDACTLPDGYAEDTTDCDDTRDVSYPGAPELCDGRDNDCDAAVDEDATDPLTWYADVDGDGFGDAAASLEACDAPADHVSNDGDCDDTTAAARPGAAEICDGLDNDCDARVDVDALDARTFFADTDGDGAGDAATTLRACTLPADAAALGNDCDDGDPTAFPGATEVCDGDDEDCDGDADEAGAQGSRTFFVDADGDTFGTDAVTTSACTAPAGFVDVDGDCDDADDATFPGAPETCDGDDDDCDTEVDEDATDAVTFYADTDGDGIGGDTTTLACSAPAGFVGTTGDCDDTTDAVRPGLDEICDQVDNDCDGSADGADAVDALTWYADGDGDSWGAGAPIVSCIAPIGAVPRAGDCDDGAEAVNPDAEETCDALDRNCDGDPIADAVDESTWFFDGDQDGFGNAAVSLVACEAPPGFGTDDSDCNDGSDTIFPGAEERCNGADDDCDTETDEGAVDATSWYLDADGDTWGTGDAVTACVAPADHIGRTGDCDDGEAATFPGAPEICDGLDNDCDSAVDDGATGTRPWFADTDGDGRGDPNVSIDACSPPDGYVALPDDCDDTEPLAWSNAAERCDGVDNDCDGTTDGPDSVDALVLFVDDDGDTYGIPGSPVRDCAVSDGLTDNALDCDDTTSAISPDAVEVCDGVDNDCSGLVDDVGPGEATVWTLDLDGDGYGADGTELAACTRPSSLYAADAGDCDDDDDAINPGVTDLCDDTDRNCDGVVAFDGDGDGWSDATCGGLDCDDSDATITPDVGGGCALGSDCLDILTSGRGDTTGIYTIDPDGYGTGQPPFETVCDMDRHGGGWTLVGSVANDGVRRWTSLGVFTDISTFGTAEAWDGTDYKNVGWATLEGLDLLVVNDEYEVGWSGLLLAESWGAFIEREYDTAQCSTDFVAGPPDLVSSNLSQSQIDMHDVIVRALDNNATCFPGSNENALISFTLSSCCWTNGLGNTPNGYPVWDVYDLSMLKLDNLVPQSCSGGYPCNPRGWYHNSGFNSYDPSTKVPYAGVYIR
jgi:hypothetical protein